MRYLTIVLFLSTTVFASTNQVEFSLRSINAVLDRIAPHAQNFPPQFSSVAERTQIEADLREAITTLDAAVAQYPDDPELLFRDGCANAMGHNLDFEGCAQAYFKAFDRLLELKPEDKKANFYYGAFLSGTAARQKDSIRYLEKAIALGESDAHYTLAFVYICQNDKPKGLLHLKEYAKLHPEDKSIQPKIEKIERSTIQISHEPPPYFDEMTKKTEANQPVQTTTMTVTPAAAQPARQP
jgi:tetratricopeptide (TPR) repeat protein